MRKEKFLSIKLRGGQRFVRLLGDSTKLKGLCSGLVALQPGDSIGEHKTENKEEVLVIIKGNATVYYSKDKSIKAGPNTFIYIPPETVHNVKNSGSKILRYVYITSKIN
ncbi:MAG: cupin domain-containing protein [Candidatus Omnitrophica bacterium]|jgi:mannose-6-phosphate isomerase-like protein (cupin superfamily)|nr:cupin domain-containing protein [Candidatus Omnitrophota bacterium]